MRPSADATSHRDTTCISPRSGHGCPKRNTDFPHEYPRFSIALFLRIVRCRYGVPPLAYKVDHRKTTCQRLPIPPAQPRPGRGFQECSFVTLADELHGPYLSLSKIPRRNRVCRDDWRPLQNRPPPTVFIQHEHD